MINVLDLYYNHPKKSSTYEVDHLDWDDAVLANDKRKLRNTLRTIGVVGKIEEVVK